MADMADHQSQLHDLDEVEEFVHSDELIHFIKREYPQHLSPETFLAENPLFLKFHPGDEAGMVDLLEEVKDMQFSEETRAKHPVLSVASKSSELQEQVIAIRHATSLANLGGFVCSKDPALGRITERLRRFPSALVKDGNDDNGLVRWGSSRALIDPPIYSSGKAQISNSAKALHDMRTIHVVLVSPMWRALETAYHAFHEHPDKDAISFVAMPELKESGAHTDVIARSYAEVKSHWQRQLNVDFSHMDHWIEEKLRAEEARLFDQEPARMNIEEDLSKDGSVLRRDASYYGYPPNSGPVEDLWPVLLLSSTLRDKIRARAWRLHSVGVRSGLGKCVTLVEEAQLSIWREAYAMQFPKPVEPREDLKARIELTKAKIQQFVDTGVTQEKKVVLVGHGNFLRALDPADKPFDNSEIRGIAINQTQASPSLPSQIALEPATSKHEK